MCLCLAFPAFTFRQLQCLMLRVVSARTEVTTGQLAGSRMESHHLTHGGLINLRGTVVELWKEDCVGNRWEETEGF